MASRGIPQYRQHGQNGHTIGKAANYRKAGAGRALATNYITTSKVDCNVFGRKATVTELKLWDYDIFFIAPSNANATDKKASTEVTILNVPTAATVAKHLPYRPEVGQYFEFTVVSNVMVKSGVSTGCVGVIVFPSTTVSNGGWAPRGGTRSKTVMRSYSSGTRLDAMPKILRYRCIWTDVTPGSEKLDYFVCG